MFPNAIVSRAPSLILFGTFEALLGGFVYTQYVLPKRNPALLAAIKSHNPRGTMNTHHQN